jgi:hypothetical protein
MKRRIQVFIEPVIDSGDYLQLELFNDEQIVVNSSVQNISDISKVFTDFSQSFTVPASTINNAIFKHFYQSDIGEINTAGSLVDHNKRRKAYIEIDLTPFRRGKISLEKSNLKNGQPESYTITFYGDIRALKDAFGEQKLSDLDLSSLEFAFTGAEILNRITDLATDYDVRYPLIANNRLWTYHQGGSTDITNTAHAIQYDELFPAVKISKLFEAIEAQYGLTFTGTFLSDPKFTNVFLQAKNSIEYSFITETQDVDFSSKAGNSSFNWNNLVSSQTAEDFVDLATNTINIQNFSPVITSHTIQLYVYSISASATIYIDVYQDGNLFQTLQTATVGALPYIVFQNTSGLNTNITFQLRATNSITVGLNMTYNVIAVIQPDVLVSVCSIQTNTTALSGNVSLNQTLPEMKVADFFSGVLKQFNATCVGVSENVFEVLPLDEWYAKGALVDVTEYTIIDSIDVERIKLYKKISFKYQESESFVNKDYFKTNAQHYGNVEYQYAYDGNEYIIESPFENLLFTQSTDGTDYAILGYFLNETLQAYTPKPTLLYLYGESDALAHDIKFYNGSGHDDISSYALFGQDFSYQNTKYSLNFGADNSVIHEETIQNGLFATYYFPYLSNLFNLKNRLISVKTNLPISLLTGLRINDRIIIRDKRYIINEMKSNLTTGDVDFTLYLDFRPVSGGLLNGGKPIELDESAQCVDVRVDLPNGAIQAELTCVTAGVTITPSTLTADGVVEICVPANANTRTQLITEDSFDFITEEYENIITEESQTQVITVVVTYTFWNGTQASNLIILQI